MNSIKTDVSDLPQKIALVHEWFSERSFGGAEKVVEAIDQLLTLKGSQPNLAGLIDGKSREKGSWLYGREIQTSFIQYLPFGVSHVQKYLPFLPFAIEQLNLDDYSLIISSSHLVAKGIITSPDQLHLSYVHTPVRYAWDQMNIYLKRSNFKKIKLEMLVRFQLHLLRQWDQLSSSRVDLFVANSHFTARRIAKYWRRNAEVIHPPVAVERFQFNKERREYYLCLSRLVPNKRVDLVVKAFNLLKLPLVIVGEGPEKKYLERIANDNISIIGYQSNEKVNNLMERCRAFVYAGIEDFGIAPVEAMAAGSPVIAYGNGGLLDTVTCASKGMSNATGILFKEQTVNSLIQAVKWFEEDRLWRKLSPELINLRSQLFNMETFHRKFEKVIVKAWASHKKKIRENSYIIR